MATRTTELVSNQFLILYFKVIKKAFDDEASTEMCELAPNTAGFDKRKITFLKALESILEDPTHSIDSHVLQITLKRLREDHAEIVPSNTQLLELFADTLHFRTAGV